MTLDTRCSSCVIADQKVDHAHSEQAAAQDRALYAEEMARVALRMLKRDGRLKPTTDDEKAAVELAGYFIDLPAARRRLLHPLAEPYVEMATEHGQAQLFGDAA